MKPHPKNNSSKFFTISPTRQEQINNSVIDALIQLNATDKEAAHSLLFLLSGTVAKKIGCSHKEMLQDIVDLINNKILDVIEKNGGNIAFNQ